MTTTTKIFVILVCLFALIFTPLTILFVGRTQNWRNLAIEAQDQYQNSAALAQSAMAVRASEAAYFQRELANQREKMLQQQQTLDELRREAAQLAQKRDEYARSRDSWENAASLLTAQNSILLAHNEELNWIKEQALEQERELQTTNMQLSDYVKELTAKLAVLNQRTQQQAQEIASYRQENQDLRQQLGMGEAGRPTTVGPSPSAAAETPAATSPIVGQVTNVRGNLVTLDVGSNSGVQEGMTMVVTRNNEYIADLQITGNVSPNESVGRVVLTNQGSQVRSNDQVSDASNF